MAGNPFIGMKLAAAMAMLSMVSPEPAPFRHERSARRPAVNHAIEPGTALLKHTDSKRRRRRKAAKAKGGNDAGQS